MLKTLKSSSLGTRFAPSTFWKTMFFHRALIMGEAFIECLKLIPCRVFACSRICCPVLHCSAKTRGVFDVISSTRGSWVTAPHFVMSVLPCKRSCSQLCGMKPYGWDNSRKYLVLNTVSRLMLFVASQCVSNTLFKEGGRQWWFLILIPGKIGGTCANGQLSCAAGSSLCWPLKVSCTSCLWYRLSKLWLG